MSEGRHLTPACLTETVPDIAKTKPKIAQVYFNLKGQRDTLTLTFPAVGLSRFCLGDIRQGEVKERGQRVI
jgi:hypothetical protein